MSENAIERRTLRVSAVTGLSTLIAIVLQIVSVPVCLKYWGKERYGSWLALYAAFMLLRSMDGGFVSYVGNELNYLYHADRPALADHLAASLLGVIVIGIIQLAISLAALFSHTILSALGLLEASGAQGKAGLALFVLVGTWGLSGPYLGIVHRLMIPTGMMYQAAWWAMAFQVGQFGAIMLAAFMHLDLLQTSLLFAFLQVAIYTASAIYIAKRLPEFYPWWRGGKLRTAVTDLGKSSLLTASALIQQGATNGLVILVSSVSGPAAVPVFTTVRTLANLWTNVTNVLTAPLLPDVVRYHATADGQKLAALSSAYWVLVGSVVNLGILATYGFVKVFYGYWTGHLLPLETPLLNLLLASVVVSNAGGLITVYLSGINRVGVLLKAALTRALVALILGKVLLVKFGLAGLGVSLLIGELLALAILGDHFARRDMPLLGVKLSVKSAAPITVSSLFVVLFLCTGSFGYAYSPYLHALSVLGVIGTGIWGWDNLAEESKKRIRNLITVGRRGRQKPDIIEPL